MKKNNEMEEFESTINLADGKPCVLLYFDKSSDAMNFYFDEDVTGSKLKLLYDDGTVCRTTIK